MTYYLVTTLESALPLSIVFLGVYIVFRLLNDFDLTVEGAFPLGASVTAVSIIGGAHPLLAMAASIGAGALAGLVTGLIHTRLRVGLLLSGILTMTALFTVNLRVMGRPNLPLLGETTVLTPLRSLPTDTRTLATLIAFSLFVAIVFGAFAYFLITEYGLTLRATGVNQAMARSVGVATNRVVIMALLISNALSALAGSLVAQHQGFADVQMGLGMIVAGVASILLGEIIMPRANRAIRGIISVLIGTIVYRLVLVVALRFGLQPFDLKLFTAIILIAALGASRGATAIRRSRSEVPEDAPEEAKRSVLPRI